MEIFDGVEVVSIVDVRFCDCESELMVYECGSIVRYGVDEIKVYVGEEGFEMWVRFKLCFVNEKFKKVKWDKKEIN